MINNKKIIIQIIGFLIVMCILNDFMILDSFSKYIFEYQLKAAEIIIN